MLSGFVTGFFGGGFCPLPDAIKLMGPIFFEEGRPFVQGAQGFGAGAIELLASLAAQVDEARFAQNPKVLGDGRLVKLQGDGYVADGALASGEEDKNLATPRFGNRVEDVGVRGGPGHDVNIHSYMGICQECADRNAAQLFCSGIVA
ncbi:MAG TPA: hypothetical protein VM865_08775 [Acidobacteriaceae bacterium]|nr:hypothetical protein [Acidobacteriaceae bacterium]